MDKGVFTLPSREIDASFGFKVDEIENQLYLQARERRPEGNLSNLSEVLHDGHQTWVGLDPQTLLTPYSECLQICELLSCQPGELVVDLGAGYGRLGLVLSVIHPATEFKGFELVEERVIEGNRVLENTQCGNARLYQQDLTADDFTLPHADYYFIYDYGKVSHIRQTLKQLEDVALKRNFKVIGRGKGVRSIIEYEHPWLADVHPVHREENFSIYSMSL